MNKKTTFFSNETTSREKKEEICQLISPYTSLAQKEEFKKKLDDKPISGFILNPAFKNTKNLLSNYESVLQSDNDSFLFYYDKDIDKLSKSIFHQGGAFYLMDPSSAVISRYLAPLIEEDAVVLDLCAAPGGKSIALSFRKPSSLILANDISDLRAKEIGKNTERLGLTNILSLNYDPIDLPEYLCDLVILDAPCSGSGMIRKEEKMLFDYSKEKVSRLLPLQRNLLDVASSHLRKGGILAYSTCSLSVEEDEDQVLDFLSRHEDFEFLPLKLEENMVSGRDGIGIHLIPGIYQGEGIYFAFLKRKGNEEISKEEIKYKPSSVFTSLHSFYRGKDEYLLSKMYESIFDLHYLAPGLKVYDDSKYAKCTFNHSYSKVSEDIPLVELDEKDALSYLHGEEIKNPSNEKGLVVLTYLNLRLGFGKADNNRIKNYLPKGLRI